jgi:hypothetical protein
MYFRPFHSTIIFSRFFQWSTLILLLSWGITAKAQQEEKQEEKQNKETQFEKITRTPFSTQNSQRFDILFTRGFLITRQDAAFDSVPINAARSGTNVLAMGFNIPLSYRFSVDIQPGIAFFRLYFFQRAEKTFPDTIQHESQKLRVSYLELPICFRTNLSFIEKDGKKIPVAFIQAGVSAGLRMGSSYKMKTRDQNNVLVTSKLHFIEGLDPLRYAGFLRLVYKSLGINVLYRFNDVFLSGRTYSYDRNGVSYPVPKSDPAGSARYPKIGEFEFGITLVL